MGLIFDIHSAKLYESWRHSPRGKAMDTFIETLIPELLEPRHKERVLDIGCGAGNHLLFLNKLGLDITGIDASPYMISLAGKRLGHRCTLKTGLAEDLPFDDNEFDLAVLIHTLEFLDDPLQALREAGRVAKRNVFIGVINGLSWQIFPDKLKGLFKETISRYSRSYTLWELKSYIRKAYGHVPVSWQSERVWPGFLDRLCGFFSDGWSLKSCPFGAFLGMVATIRYTVKTNNLPLKIRVEKAERSSVAEGITTMGDPKYTVNQ
jgi:ubiquinone/menaquinone biosynthesis C-methylase UbiE